MKKFFSSFLLLILCSLVFPQNPYNDALFLRSRYEPVTNKIALTNEVRQALSVYYPGVSADSIDKNLPDSNPFLKGIFVNYTAQFDVTSFSKGKFSEIGAIDVTRLSKGISLFLIERGKQELTIAFFDKFKNFVEKNAEIRTLFPNTTYCLGNLLAYQYSQMLPVLQVAFNKDMQILPQDLVEVLTMEPYFSKVKDFPELFVIIKSIELLQQINQLSPPELIESLPGIADAEKFPELGNLHSALKLVTIFSNSIRTNDFDSNNYWISPDAFYVNIIQDTVSLNLFLGLVYQQIVNEKIEVRGKPLASLITKKENEVLWYKMQYEKLLIQVDNIQTAAKRIKQLKDVGSMPTNQEIYEYVNTTIDLFEFGYRIGSHYFPDSTKMDIYIDIAKNANSLYINTISQKYALAMNNAINILSAVNNRPGSGKNKVYSERNISGLATYGTFIANIADAGTPEEVQAAIEAAALPAGSSSFKKNYRNNVALNAYLGVNAGNWPKNESSSVTWNGDFRLTAPIGIAWTPFSFGKKGSISVFGSVLDVGAIVDYQLKTTDSTQEIDQKIYLANIFSPGGYIVYGMPWNVPISIGFGGQYGPGLIKMGDNLWNPGWRWNFFLAIDIPVFNLKKGKGITR